MLKVANPEANAQLPRPGPSSYESRRLEGFLATAVDVEPRDLTVTDFPHVHDREGGLDAAVARLSSKADGHHHPTAGVDELGGLHRHFLECLELVARELPKPLITSVLAGLREHAARPQHDVRKAEILDGS